MKQLLFLKEENNMEDYEIEEVVSEALAMFWEHVSDRYPDIRSGDLSPQALAKLQLAADDAVTEWVGLNK